MTVYGQLITLSFSEDTLNLYQENFMYDKYFYVLKKCTCTAITLALVFYNGDTYHIDHSRDTKYESDEGVMLFHRFKKCKNILWEIVSYFPTITPRFNYSKAAQIMAIIRK